MFRDLVDSSVYFSYFMENFEEMYMYCASSKGLSVFTTCI